MVDYVERLELALKHAQVTPKDLQLHLGVSYQAMKKLMGGVSKSLSAENHARAARFLGVNSYWLATGEEGMTSASPYDSNAGESVRLLAREKMAEYQSEWPFTQLTPADFRRMNQRQRELIEAYARGLVDESLKNKSA